MLDKSSKMQNRTVRRSAIIRATAKAKQAIREDVETVHT
jgi:hypothetical protein